MSKHAYHYPAREARQALERAMQKAKLILPYNVITHHFIAGHHSPASWESTESWWRIQPGADRETMAILSDLTSMAQALTCLTAVEKSGEEQPLKDGWQKLAKVRRSA